MELGYVNKGHIIPSLIIRLLAKFWIKSYSPVYFLSPRCKSPGGLQQKFRSPSCPVGNSAPQTLCTPTTLLKEISESCLSRWRMVHPKYFAGPGHFQQKFRNPSCPSWRSGTADGKCFKPCKHVEQNFAPQIHLPIKFSATLGYTDYIPYEDNYYSRDNFHPNG